LDVCVLFCEGGAGWGGTVKFSLTISLTISFFSYLFFPFFFFFFFFSSFFFDTNL